MKRLWLTCLLLFIPLVGLTSESTSRSSALQKVQHNGELIGLNQLLTDQKLTGLSLAIVDDYRLVHSAQAGYKEAGKPEKIDMNTMFSTASISKPIFATVVLMLVEQNKLDLDKPINTYLTRWKLPESELTTGNPVTLRGLLSHTAGTTQGGFADFYLGDNIPTLLDSLNGKLPRFKDPLSVTFEPGSDWQYSGGGYVLAQVAVEDLTGKPLAELAKNMIFDPLGMTRTTMYQHGEEGFPDNLAKVHDKEQQVIGTGIPICPQIAPSGMWSNATDMATLLIDFQKALNGKESRVISRWVAEQSTTIQAIHKMGGWGLGWMRMEADGNLEWFSHGGSNTGTGGHILATMEQGRAIVVFGNGPNNVRIPVINSLKKHVINTLGWKKPLLAANVKPAKQLVKSMQGRYLSPFDEIVEVKRKDDKLIATNIWFYLDQSELVYTQNGQFETDDLPHVITLERNPQDNNTYLTFTRKGTSLKEYALRKLPDDEQVPFDVAQTGRFEDTLSAYQSWQKRYPDSGLTSARALNSAGYKALSEKQFEVAMNLFNVYVTLYPDDANAFDSLAESYMLSGKNKLAIKNYQASLRLNPDNSNAKEMLTKLKAH